MGTGGGTIRVPSCTIHFSRQSESIELSPCLSCFAGSCSYAFIVLLDQRCEVGVQSHKHEETCER
eukprot:3118472-Amphidinium_carterae.1